MSQISLVQKTRSTLLGVWRFLIRMDLATIFLTTLILLIALGSFFPQAPSKDTANLVDISKWQDGLHQKYGSLVDRLSLLGVFHFFNTPVFNSCLFILGITTLFCLLNRWIGIWTLTFQSKVQISTVVFQNARYNANIGAFPGLKTSNILQKYLIEHGFRMKTFQDSKLTHIRADRHRLTLLATLISHMSLILLLSGYFISNLFGWRETMTLPPEESLPVNHLPNITLKNEGFKIEHYPDGNVSDYLAQILIKDQKVDNKELSGSLQLNEPFTTGDVGYYLQSFESTKLGDKITVLVVHDPGYGLVILAWFLLLLGLTITFNFPHAVIYGRYDTPGNLSLAGSAQHWDYSFSNEFAGLVVEIENQLGQVSKVNDRYDS